MRIHQLPRHTPTAAARSKFSFPTLFAPPLPSSPPLRLENILFDEDKEDAEVKLIDFGLSTFFQPDEAMTLVAGTPMCECGEAAWVGGRGSGGGGCRSFMHQRTPTLRCA